MPQPLPAFKNRVLAGLAPDDLALLLPHLQPVELPQRTVLYDIGDRIADVYFMEQGVASVITMMADGASIEVGMAGYEGMVPVAALMGDDVSAQHIVIQLPGSAYKMNTARCRDAFEHSPGIRKSLLQFANLFLKLSTQTAACNRLHSVEQRFARWLLMSSDRVQSDTLPLTQDYISFMLGIRRTGVSESAGEMQRSGLIAYHHGLLKIIDREGL